MKNDTFGKILLAVDGSEAATAAARVATSFAHAASAQVKVAHVWNMEVHRENGVWDLETRREAEELLNDTITSLRASGVTAEGQLISADRKHVASALAQAARVFQADLVVVGSRGLVDWRAVGGHSVSHQLITALDCPLLVVRGKPALGLHDAHKVLLAVAGGDDVVPAAKAAIAAATAPGSKVLVLHVAQAIFGPQGFAYVEADEEISETLKSATEMLEAAGIPTQAMAAGSGHVADVVAETAAGWGADVIVIGSSRMGDLASIFLGSVTHDLLRATRRPVLIAERPER